MNDFEAIWAYAIRHLTANNANDLHGTVHWRQVERHGRALATGRYHDNISVATCWDADRLDLGRVGLRPDPQRSIAQAAKKRLNSQTLTVETPIKSTVNH